MMSDERNVMDQLADLLDDAFVPRKQKCSFGELLENAPDKVRNALNVMLGNKEISVRKIHMLLKKSGAAIGRDTLADHRNKRCVCYPIQKQGASE